MLTGAYRFPAMESVIYGRAFADVVKEEVERADAHAVFVIASGTLARETDLVERLKAALGNRFAGLCAKIGSHTPRVDCIAAADAAREARTDLIVTLGGGSVTDAAKIVAMCLSNDIRDAADFDNYRARIDADGKSIRPPIQAPRVRTITVPTTLSAGEYTASAGCTDTVRNVKESYGHPMMMAKAVVLDPAATVHTPEWLLLSTGIRAVDHAVEDICSPLCQPLSEGASAQALKLLGRGLRSVKNDAGDLDARLECQLGAWLSMIGSQTGIPKGASHGIGHVLGGTAHVPHGYTSCVMLPHVLRFNHAVNADRQALVSDALGDREAPAADLVAALIADLGLPSRLRDVGVGHEQLDRIAELSMHDRWIHTNPRKIEGPSVVRQILDAAW
ncbi:MAG: iron-containing alcohol dehydrogenase [Alphaproteobacteria bacterium]|nr:iron-containing alcohol dehydrogenase [Alphaproteobacteria bacterium]